MEDFFRGFFQMLFLAIGVFGGIAAWAQLSKLIGSIREGKRVKKIMEGK